ncbi:MAG: hypothetical protein FWH28_08745 [Clostridiales bacterium]|nr:hypothetical protein [Clostridiales bacterium]
MHTRDRIMALENGKGIKYLLDSAYTIFNNPTYMIDSNYCLIAASDGPMEIPAWSELILTGTYSLQAREYMAQAGIYDTIAGIYDAVTHIKKPIYLEKGEGRSYGVMTGQVVNKEKDAVAELVMYEYYSSFDAEAMEAFEALVDKIEHEIHNYEYFIKLPTVFYEDTIHKLLDRTAMNTIVHHSQARMIKMRYEKYLYVAVVYARQYNMLDSIQRSRLEYFRSLLKNKYSERPFIYAIYSEYIVMLLGSAFGVFTEAMPLGKEYDFYTHNKLYVGISESFEDIFEFDLNYDKAVATLQNGMEKNNGERIFVS